jgi:dynein light chain LC8-type
MAAHHGSSRKTKAEQWLFGGRWRRTVKETKHPVASEAKPPAPTFPTAIQKDGDICLEKSRVHLPGLGQREIIDIAPGRKSMPEVEINMKEVVSVLGVKVMAADMSPFMQLHAFRCAKRSHDSLDKFSSRQLAHDVKKVSLFFFLSICDLSLVCLLLFCILKGIALIPFIVYAPSLCLLDGFFVKSNFRNLSFMLSIMRCTSSIFCIMQCT